MLMAEFVTAVKYKLPIKVVIIKNNTLGQIKWEQMVFLGNPEFGCDLQPIDFAAFARACGGTGFHDRRSGRAAARFWIEALATPGRCWSRRWSIRMSRRCRRKPRSSRPLQFAKSLVRGEPDRGKIISDDLRGQGQGDDLTRTPGREICSAAFVSYGPAF